MVVKLAMPKGLASGCVECIEGPFVDEIRRLLAACNCVGYEGMAISISVGH